MRYTIADLIAALEAAQLLDRLRADAADFCARHLEADPEPGVVDFLDVSTGDAFSVNPAEAQAYFRGKGLRPTFSYADMLGAAHDQAFTVAKMMDVDLLKQVRDSLDSAMANGTAFGEWRKDLSQVLQGAGWWGKALMPDPLTGQVVNAQLGSASRLETIFRTNMQTSYAAGQWKEIETQSDVAPFLMYDAIDDFRTRPAHRAWDGIVLPVKDAWWTSHYPPNGYNCRCSVIQLDEQQLRDMGITPRAEPPDDGTYPWKNPRTGKTIDVPNGLDPGFDRNAGHILIDQLRTVLDQKVQALPDSMKAAVAPALRRTFNAGTDAGRWHVKSFDEAPDWLRDKVIDHQAVSVQFDSRTGAWARGGALVDMDGKKEAEAAAQSIWRHEFGHILDWRLQKTTLYRSAQDDFVQAQKKDADALVSAAGAARKSAAADARRAKVVQAYEDARTRMIDTERDARPDALRQLAADAGLDFGRFMSVVRESTNVAESMDSLREVGAAVRVARMIEALRLGDGEGFLRWASFKDLVEQDALQRRYVVDTIKQANESWRKDGALSSLSDLVGSATKNKAADFKQGFPGHSTAYYRKAAYFPTTESFANLTSLAGHRNPYWWDLVEKLTPNMAKLFRDIIEGKA